MAIGILIRAVHIEVTYQYDRHLPYQFAQHTHIQLCAIYAVGCLAIVLVGNCKIKLRFRFIVTEANPSQSTRDGIGIAKVVPCISSSGWMAIDIPKALIYYRIFIFLIENTIIRVVVAISLNIITGIIR